MTHHHSRHDVLDVYIYYERGCEFVSPYVVEQCIDIQWYMKISLPLSSSKYTNIGHIGI